MTHEKGGNKSENKVKHQSVTLKTMTSRREEKNKEKNEIQEKIMQTSVPLKTMMRGT